MFLLILVEIVLIDFACGPADATAIPKPHRLLPHLNADRFYLSGSGLPRLSWRWLVGVGVEFNAPLDTISVISEAVFTANYLTDTDKQNSTGKYR